METNITIVNEAPDNPMAVLTLFDADRAALIRMTDYIVNTAESGMDDPDKIFAYLKKVDFVCKAALEKVKPLAERAAALHGAAYTLAGSELSIGTVHTAYDYSNTPLWVELNNRIKELETVLKTITAPMETVDKVSGEVMTFNPGVKKQTEGIKVSIK